MIRLLHLSLHMPDTKYISDMHIVDTRDFCMDMTAHIFFRSIPKYKTSVGLAWDTANDKVKEDMVNLFKTDQGPSGTYYRSCMDIDKIDKEAAKPVEPWLAVIDKVDDMPSLVTALVELNKVDIDTLFSWYIDRCVDMILLHLFM
jgi:predicted metalloendopeptidase